MKTDIKIRVAKENDFSYCKQIGLQNYEKLIKKKREYIAGYLFKNYFKEISFKERQEKNKFEIYVATYLDKVIGFIELEEKAELSSIYIDLEYQNKGVGSRLLDKAEQLCLEDSKKEIKITLNASDYAIDFYQKRGYHRKGKTRKLFGVNMTPMVKKLR